MKILVSSHFKEKFMKLGFYKPARACYRLLFNNESSQKYRQALKFYKSILPSNSLCFDVGAHIGEKTEIFLDLGMKVIAFEPQPECVKEIYLRCKKAEHRLQILQEGLGAYSGFAELYISSISNKSSLNPNWVSVSKHQKINVTMTTLDQAILKYGIPYYCKIDVEGHDLDVLKGLTHPLNLLSFEYHLWDEEIQKSIKCVEYIAKLWEAIEVNITPAEAHTFLFKNWISPNEFLRIFPDKLLDRPEYNYGDIFVRQA